ncbi:hypothetical protein KM1_078110 [Entamoeba histolytica HM-3:IMSS]|nr:hypothetical protein KM1_078110 [Entamoeba histolytica HM-3:IMSS]GAT96334.1 hypothetical protein CL6EHI_189450 [Entamoeba histolytica]
MLVSYRYEKLIFLSFFGFVGLLFLATLFFGTTQPPPDIRMKVTPNGKRDIGVNQYLSNINHWMSSSFYTIALLSISSMKPETFESNEHLKFITIQDKFKPNEWWAKNGYLVSLHDFGYLQEEIEFDDYKEKISLNWAFNERLKYIPDEVDFVFVTSLLDPELNKTQVEMTLHYYFDQINQSIDDICLLGINKKSTNEIKKVYAKWPSVQFQGISGLIIPRNSIRGIKRMLYSSHYLNSFELLIQHYCEVDEKPILLSPLYTFLPEEF